jgi:hypothetical protein
MTRPQTRTTIHFLKEVPDYGTSVTVTETVAAVTVAVQRASVNKRDFVRLTRVGGHDITLPTRLIGPISQSPQVYS